ncbi:MAG: RNA polymerase sigma factor [Actinomycetota bacterium]|nr:RNA polymerase sigma factor [Actinomycetota bacterium]
MDDVSVAERHDLEQVYREQGRRLWWAVLAFSGDREIASDAVAEAFAQALRAAEGIREPANWVWRVAFRVAAAELKGRGRRSDVPIEGSYEMDHRARELLASLARLSPRQRSAIALHYYGGYTAREIGSMTGSAAATVAVHLHRGRKRLREILEESDD